MLLRHISYLSLAVSLLLPYAALAKQPDDTYYEQQLSAQYDGDDLKIEKAWKLTTGGDSVVVAIIDSGVDTSHPDLVDNIWTNPGETGLTDDSSSCWTGVSVSKETNNCDDDANGYNDDVHGWNFYDDNSIITPNQNEDDSAQEHGTNVAGIIGATGNNSTGIAGINWSVQLMVLKISDAHGNTSASASAAAIRYARKNGAHVINMSYELAKSDAAEKRALNKAYKSGILTVAAVGNQGEDTTKHPHYPACYPHVIGVASVNIYTGMIDQGNYGDCADIAAQGFHLYTTTLFDVDPEEEFYSYSYFAGTSAATPMVTGVAALMKAWANTHNRTLTAKQWEQILMRSSKDHVSEVIVGTLGYGRLAAYAALKQVKEFTDPNIPSTIAYKNKHKKNQLIPGKAEFDATPYFTWSAPTTTNHGEVEHYYVYFGKNADANPLQYNKTTDHTYRPDTLTAADTYYLKIRAKYEDGEYSDTAKFTYEYSE